MPLSFPFRFNVRSHISPLYDTTGGPKRDTGYDLYSGDLVEIAGRSKNYWKINTFGNVTHSVPALINVWTPISTLYNDIRQWLKDENPGMRTGEANALINALPILEYENPPRQYTPTTGYMPTISKVRGPSTPTPAGTEPPAHGVSKIILWLLGGLATLGIGTYLFKKMKRRRK